MTNSIVQDGDTILRKKAQHVPKHAFLTGEVKDIVRRMHKALNSREEGVAIAAPQIGESYRIFIVSSKIFNNEHTLPPLVFINPVLKDVSRKKELMEEGCLSVPEYTGIVQRSVEATVEAVDEEGDPFTLTGKGLLAQIFQHETDHLDGVLFIDKAQRLKTLEGYDEEN